MTLLKNRAFGCEYVLNRLIAQLAPLNIIGSAIVDGSVRNGEFVKGYSDLDLKVFLKANKTNISAYRGLHNIIKNAVGSTRIRANVWCLSGREFPTSYPGGMFDFVHRHVLACGIVVLGADKHGHIVVPKSVGIVEWAACTAALERFLLRLRRLYVTPLAPSDVTRPNSLLYLQQGLAYFFHALRYYNAFNGFVVLSIANNVQMISSHNAKMRAKLARELYVLRNNWGKHIFTIVEARQLLLSIILAIESMHQSIYRHKNRKRVQLTYSTEKAIT